MPSFLKSGKKLKKVRTQVNLNYLKGSLIEMNASLGTDERREVRRPVSSTTKELRRFLLGSLSKKVLVDQLPPFWFTQVLEGSALVTSRFNFGKFMVFKKILREFSIL